MSRIRRLLAPILAVLLTSCTCFGPSASNSAACVAAKAVVDCTGNATLASLLPMVTQMIATLLQLGEFKWDTFITNLEGAGYKDIGCIVAQLITNLKATGDPAQVKAGEGLDKAFGAWKAKNGLSNTKFMIRSPLGGTATESL